MKLRINDQDFYLRFWHLRMELTAKDSPAATFPAIMDWDRETRRRFRRSRGVTVCAITRADEHRTPIGIGEGWCSRKDNFCKEKGRVKALERALEDVTDGEGWETLERRAVWEQYRARKGAAPNVTTTTSNA